jgi:hypothetical protein
MLHSGPSLDALSVRSDGIRSINSLSLLCRGVPGQVHAGRAAQGGRGARDRVGQRLPDVGRSYMEREFNQKNLAITFWHTNLSLCLVKKMLCCVVNFIDRKF